MALSDFTGPGYIDAWTADLDARWPEREAMADCVVGTLGRWRDEGGGEGSHARHDGRSGEVRRGEERRERCKREHHQVGSRGGRPLGVIRLLELGVGAGRLATSVLNSLADASGEGPPTDFEYTGIEIEPALVLHGKELLEAAGHRNIRLVRADLKDDAWTEGIGPFDAVFTLQTLHDLGGIDALEAVYRQIHRLLSPGGTLVNADFVVPFEKDNPERPRRLPVGTHKDLLSSLGYVDFRCELRQEKMACMSAKCA